MTRVFGVLGYPLSHSLSPIMHQAAYEALDLDALYAPFQVPPSQLSKVLRGLERAGIDGLNVTVPHKERVRRWLGERRIDDAARDIGAVNTLLRRDGRLIGTNTDVEGFRGVLQELRCAIHGKPVLLLGAGGAARAVAFTLLHDGAGRVWLTNRTASRANGLHRWMRRQRLGASVEVVDWTVRASVARRAEVVVNATSLGLRPSDPLPLPASALHEGQVVVDLVYAAPTTRLVQEARRRRALAADGVPMLVYQGAASFRLWWKRPAPVTAMRKVVEQEVRCGKP